MLAIDAGHGRRVNALERSLRSRNRLLEEAAPDPHWLDAVEHETAELAVAVAAAAPRPCAARRRARGAHDDEASFPPGEIALDGWIEAMVLEPARGRRSRTAIARVLREIARATPPPAGRSTARISAISRSRHAAKDIAAADASTGEQKALLIGLVLAHAGLVGEMSGTAPVLLLDEVVAHLDPRAARARSTDWLAQLGAQVWMTGADPAAFADIAARSEVIEISPGQAKRVA